MQPPTQVAPSPAGVIAVILMTILISACIGNNVAPSGSLANQYFRDCADCPEMVAIPGGTFAMGSAAAEVGRDPDEGPAHRVTIARAFALSRTPVTRGLFAQFIDASGYRPSPGCRAWSGTDWVADPVLSWRVPGYAQRDDHPVVCINWLDARAYADWLSGETGEAYRLVSESEWEYAARAGQPGPTPWGRVAAAACRFANVHDRRGQAALQSDWAFHDCDDGFAQTAPVGRFPANEFGLSDMLGNVWEWTADCYHQNYAGAPWDGSAWISGTDYQRRVLRGGAWNNRPKYMRFAFRLRINIHRRMNIYGFRIARDM